MVTDDSFLLDALEDAPSPLAICRADLGCVFTNAAFRRLLQLGFAPESLAEFWPDGSAELLSVHDVRTSLRSASGSDLPVRMDCSPLAQGLYLLTVVEQGAQLLSGESEIIEENSRSQRLETLGLLAGGIAHDFNNVLTGILGHITYLKTILPRTGDHVESLTTIEEGARKASSMTQQILNFSKSSAEERPSPIDLVATTQSTLKLLRGAISSGCSLQLQVPEDRVSVLAVEGRLSQVLINLVVNARDAVGPDGRIEVRVEVTSDEQELERAFKGSDLSSYSYARIDVIDNGHGITEEVRSRMFEPYFSTKKAMGTGLGLATVAQTVTFFGGAITVDSHVGVGTRISVYLPIVGGGAPEVTATPPGREPELQSGRERILIVDDEYPVRNVLCVSLEHLGYNVETASTGIEAIEKFQGADLPFDLVILDMIMPQLSGDKVFIRLQEIDPEVRVLVISGYSSEAAVQSILDRGGLDFMQKPFTIEELSRKVRECVRPS